MEKMIENKCMRCGGEVTKTTVTRFSKKLSGLIICGMCEKWMKEDSRNFAFQAKKLLILFKKLGYEVSSEPPTTLGNLATLEIKCKVSDNRTAVYIYDAFFAERQSSFINVTPHRWFVFQSQAFMLRVPDTLLVDNFADASLMITNHVANVFEIRRTGIKEPNRDEGLLNDMGELLIKLYDYTKEAEEQRDYNMRFQLRLSKTLTEIENRLKITNGSDQFSGSEASKDEDSVGGLMI